MSSIWDLYLDGSDAQPLLEALAVIERARAVREPLPLADPPRLLARLQLIAQIAREEATHWRNECEDRQAEAAADGGRWGSVEAARTMSDIARDLAAGSRQIAEVSEAAVDDLAPRLVAGRAIDVLRAEAAAKSDTAALLARHPDGHSGP